MAKIFTYSQFYPCDTLWLTFHAHFRSPCPRPCANSFRWRGRGNYVISTHFEMRRHFPSFEFSQTTIRSAWSLLVKRCHWDCMRPRHDGIKVLCYDWEHKNRRCFRWPLGNKMKSLQQLENLYFMWFFFKVDILLIGKLEHKTFLLIFFSWAH